MHDKVSDAAIREAVGRAVAERRKALGMSQAEAALMMGMTQGMVSKIEAGQVPATVTLLIRIAPALHTVPWLLLAQAVGSPEEREVAERMYTLMTTRPGAWQLVLAMLRPAVRDTLS